MLNSTTLVKPASMTERVWFLLLLLSSVSQVVDSGVCISPQASWAPYCQPSYQVYALYESARTDVNYWLQLDQQAQAQATQWKNTLGCDDVRAPSSFVLTHGHVWPECDHRQELVQELCLRSQLPQVRHDQHRSSSGLQANVQRLLPDMLA
mmetsp:Transcript_23432/g.76163  ORF Transcript_23432/g.76163 Transcript_23432/m.76163 type:complete len:151 (-) Transcript_23432:68-520(-)